MAIKYYVGDKVTGLSTDTKPTTTITEGTLYFELDTARIFIFYGGAWTEVLYNSHNSLADLQGGAASEYYHLTQTQHTRATNFLDGGTNTHTDVDNHISDNTIHFTEASIDHNNITNNGTNTHAQIDTHISDDTKHRTINDAGTATTDLWSADKISTEFSSLATVASSGDYGDLINKPDLSALEEVLVYDDLASFPATGEVEKVYIASDTGYMYRWNGSGYTQLTDQTAIWGQISGTLSDQTDLNTELNNKLETVATDGSISGDGTPGSPLSVDPTSGYIIVTPTGGSQTISAPQAACLFVDVSTYATSIQLPTSPSLGHTVIVSDFKFNSSVNNITILRNGSNINTQADDLILDIDGASVELTYSDSGTGWMVIQR